MFSKRLINVEEISKRFGDFHALDGTSFHIRENEIVALLGCNGAGKTTALNIITGFLKPDSGVVELLGYNIQKDLHKIRNQIGFLTSEMGLYEKLTIEESINFLGQLRGLSKNNLFDRKKYFWDLFDLGSIAKKKFNELSSGQKQKALITAAVIHNPQIMIFDEITASLDVVTCKNIMDFLKTEKEAGKAILFSTHILAEAEYLSDRIIVVHNGKIIEENTTEEMKRRHNVGSLFEAFFKTVDESKDIA